jgi:hypothetical protein
MVSGPGLTACRLFCGLQAAVVTDEREVEGRGALPSTSLRAGFVENRDEWGSLSRDSASSQKSKMELRLGRWDVPHF